MTTGRVFQTATLLSDSRVLILGGYGPASNKALASAELYDPKTGTFSATGSMSTAISSITATLLADGRVLVAGGAFPNLDSFEIYNPKTGQFSATGSPVSPRAGETATLLRDGRVLVAGGNSNQMELASAELYDPATGEFSVTGSMIAGRRLHTATLLSDGRVLIAGGSTMSGQPLTSAELYDPATGRFATTGSMTTTRSGSISTSRSCFTANLLLDGRVLFAGGNDGSATLASAELYDPKTGTFSATGSMSMPRQDLTATNLADGRVLIAGDDDAGASNDAVRSAELYDPKTGTFSLTGSMGAVRFESTATGLSDGRVLIAGGADTSNVAAGGWPALATAELYQP
jgi:hypothetical protein